MKTHTFSRTPTLSQQSRKYCHYAHKCVSACVCVCKR